MDALAGHLPARLAPHLGIQTHILRMIVIRQKYVLGSQILQEGDHVAQLGIGSIVNERGTLDSVPRLELETLGGIVDDHDGAEVATQQTQVLHKYAIRLNAMVTEETGGDDMIRVHLVQQRICVLNVTEKRNANDAHARRVDHHLVELAHAVDELDRARS